MSNQHPALTPEHLAKLEGESIWAAQHTLMASSAQSLPQQFQINNDAVLYGALMAEENGETLEALANAVGVVDEATAEKVMPLLAKLSGLGTMMRDVSKEIRKELAAAPKFATNFDLENLKHRNALKPLLDGASDTLVVTAGLMNATGMDGTLSYGAAQQSNHTKIDPATGMMFKGEDGKWIKGPHFTEPDWDLVIDTTVARRQQ